MSEQVHSMMCRIRLSTGHGKPKVTIFEKKVMENHGKSQIFIGRIEKIEKKIRNRVASFWKTGKSQGNSVVREKSEKFGSQGKVSEFCQKSGNFIKVQ